MKKIFYLFLVAVVLTFTSCGGDDPAPVSCTDGIQNQGEEDIDCGGPCTACQVANEDVTGLITSNTTWTKDRIWVLNQKVVVGNGVTLTIEAGTIIKGAEGQLSLSSALIIAQGGKLMAEGTASEPIIFTSILDNIAVGETAGPNLDINDSGLWGGVVVLGKAPISISGDVESGNIEGIPSDETFGVYGGTNTADNSGTLSYISIRHGGITIAPDNELNGLTLGGVGSGTTISNIEVVANQDDGVEFFGGTVNPTNLVVWAQGDDGLDIDQAYAGTITNAVVALGASSGSALEIDGPEGSSATADSFTLNDITLIGYAGGGSKYADYRKSALGANNNIFAYGFDAGSNVKFQSGSEVTFQDGDLTFANWEIVLPAGDTIDGIPSGDVIVGTESNFTDHATGVTAGNETVGATMSSFDWTYAHANGAF